MQTWLHDRRFRIAAFGLMLLYALWLFAIVPWWLPPAVLAIGAAVARFTGKGRPR